ILITSMKIYRRDPPSKQQPFGMATAVGASNGTTRMNPMSMLDRRKFLGGTVAAGASLGHALPAWAEAAGLDLPNALPEGVRASAVLEALPGKKPLIKLSYRPPNYETPLEYF